MTTPGNPPPCRGRPRFWLRCDVEKLQQIGRRDGSRDLEVVDGAIRLVLAATPAADRRSDPAAPLFHVKQALVRQPHAARSVVEASHRLGALFHDDGRSRDPRVRRASRRRWAASSIERRRSHAVDTAPPARPSAAARLRASGGPRWRGPAPRNNRRLRHAQALIPPVGSDIGSLPLEIDSVFGVDLELVARSWA